MCWAVPIAGAEAEASAAMIQVVEAAEDLADLAVETPAAVELRAIGN